MATKNSTQEEQIQNVSAPRAEPRAANMIIPRRDLLTGTALVLVGSASGCASSLQASGSPNPIRTDFMQDFTKEFIGDPANIKPPGQLDDWPDPNRAWPTLAANIGTEYATFVNVLMNVGYLGAPPPTTASGLEGQIGRYLQADKAATGWKKLGWPAGSPQLSSQYDVHLVEIAVIQDRLLQAINSFARKLGGGSSWPPH